MKYRCLVIDHDDTSVDSTPEIHYPAYLRMMKELRPQTQPLSLDGFFRVNFHPGYFVHMREELGMDDAEIAAEIDIWRGFVAHRIPRFFAGLLNLLEEYRSRGGAIAVVSHSEETIIRRDYEAGTEGSFTPDIIWGWQDDAKRRKPSSYPLEQILAELGMVPGDALVVDDLLPGITMAQSMGVDAVAAGWAHRVAEIRQGIRDAGVPCLETVAELAAYVMEGGAA